jgi:NADPH:quinone reductase
MRAAIMDGFGTPDRLRIADAPMPQCGPRDIVIEVAAAGVNPVDWKECEGHLVPFYGEYAPQWTPGYDGAGIVSEVGGEVTGFTSGDRVVAFSDRRENGHNGTFAEHFRVLENAAARVPDRVGLDEAAAIPTAALTGYQALFREQKAGLQAGDTVLVHGASGGVGSYTVQFAKARGLEVAATCSARNADYVRSLGADLVIDYAAGGIVAAVREWAPDRVAAVIDCVSGGTLPDALDALSPGGKWISIATVTADGDVEGDAQAASERGFAKILSIMEFDRIGEELAEVLAMMAEGHVRTPPLEAYPLEDAAKALERMKAGGVRGKIVLTTGRGR